MTTHEDDPHPDHANTSIIVRQAARLATMGRYDEESGLAPVPMPAIMHSLFSRRIVPSFVVDVSEFVDEKMNAIRAYASQFYNAASKEPATRISQRGFLQEIEFRMRYFGSLIGVEAGEPFYVREALNVDDPLALLTRPMNIYFINPFCDPRSFAFWVQYRPRDRDRRHGARSFSLKSTRQLNRTIVIRGREVSEDSIEIELGNVVSVNR